MIDRSLKDQATEVGREADLKNERVLDAVRGLIAAYDQADPDKGEEHVHIPTTEIIEWKGMANIWHASIDEYRETVEARKEEPTVQKPIEESVEWLSDLTALVRMRVRTSLPDGHSFESPALFIVTPDRAGAYKVAMSWWGAFPSWFRG